MRAIPARSDGPTWPDVLLRRVAIAGDGFKPSPIGRIERDRRSRSHVSHSHTNTEIGTSNGMCRCRLNH